MRDLDTYRGARRNACLRGDVKQVWGPAHYHDGHDHNAGNRRRRKAGRRIVKVAGKPASPVAKMRPAARAPAINKAAPRGQ